MNDRQNQPMHRALALIRAPVAMLALREIGVIAVVFVGAAMLLSFVILAGEVVEGDTHSLDVWLMSLFLDAGDPAERIGPAWFEEMVRDVTALGSYAFIILTVLIVTGYLLLSRKTGLAGLVVVAVAGGMLLSNLLKAGFDRPRPDVEHAARVFSASFPSGHATLSAVTFLTLAALLTRARARRRVKIYFVSVAVILTILTGLSRVYLGVHYPSDVLAGWCIGSAWAILCWAAALIVQRRRGSSSGVVGSNGMSAVRPQI
jgi:undecaprenyl-diphosphatase